MDANRPSEDGFASSYSQLFKSTTIVETTGKLNKNFETDEKEDSIYKCLPEPKTNIRKLPSLLEAANNKLPELSTRLKIKEEQKVIKAQKQPKIPKEIKEADESNITKDPKVQVVTEGHFFNRRKTFIKNWDYNQDNVNQDAVEED